MAWDWDKLQSQRKDTSNRDSGIPSGIEDVFEKIRHSKGKLPGGIWLIMVAAIVIFFGSSCL